MAIPEQIKKQSDNVRSLYEEHYPEGEGADPKPELAVVDDKEGDATPKAEPVGDTVTPEVASEPSNEGRGEDFEQKYKSLQGIHNQQMASYSTRIAQLEELLSSVNTTQTAPKEPEPEPTFQPSLSESEISEYGESIDIMKKVTRDELFSLTNKVNKLEQVVMSLSSDLNSTVVPQVQTVAKRQSETAYNQFWDTLNRQVPNWEEINNDDNFKLWLMEVDELTGATRQSFLEQAHKDRDAKRVASFFTQFSALSGGQPAAHIEPSANIPTPSVNPELEAQLAPGKSRGGKTPSGQGEPKTYTRGEISKFYADCTKGKYRGKEKERAKLERDIFAAKQEGRITE